MPTVTAAQQNWAAVPAVRPAQQEIRDEVEVEAILKRCATTLTPLQVISPSGRDPHVRLHGFLSLRLGVQTQHLINRAIYLGSLVLGPNGPTRSCPDRENP